MEAGTNTSLNSILLNFIKFSTVIYNCVLESELVVVFCGLMWWRKQESPEKTINLGRLTTTLSDDIDDRAPRSSGQNVRFRCGSYRAIIPLASQLKCSLAIRTLIGLNNILFAIKYIRKDIYKSVQKRI